MKKGYEFLEDYEPGQTGVTRMRTVGEPVIVSFGCITCDYSYLHLAHHPTMEGPYGGRIAHGLLGTSLARWDGEPRREACTARTRRRQGDADWRKGSILNVGDFATSRTAARCTCADDS